jgi:hypothetical protein
MSKGQEKSNIQAQGQDLELAKQKIQKWRLTSKHKERIPEELWQLAVSLTSTYRIGRVARELRLNFSALKNRLDVDSKAESGIIDKSDSFVEVKVLPENGVLPMSSACVMELTRVDGANLKIYSTMGSRIDIMGICENFLKG